MNKIIEINQKDISCVCGGGGAIKNIMFVFASGYFTDFSKNIFKSPDGGFKSKIIPSLKSSLAGGAAAITYVLVGRMLESPKHIRKDNNTPANTTHVNLKQVEE